MAYNSVSTPRFYINVPEWLASTGAATLDQPFQEHLRTLPVKLWDSKDADGNAVLTDNQINLPSLQGMTANGFVAVLGHNYGDSEGYYRLKYPDNSNVDVTSVINGGNYPSYSGFSISTFTGDNTITDFLVSQSSDQLGSIVIGTYFDMPHSPDLNLTISYETGTKNIETRGGASLSNTIWRPPIWGNLAQWELASAGASTNNQALAHSSRRTWSLSFSFLDKTNTFPKYNALNRLVDQEETLPDDETLLTSDDFFSAVWNKVGTALPFIFQPDKDTPEFAICKFDQKNISFQQTLPSRYSVKCKIRECW